MGESSLADDLRAARALIDTPEKWTQGTWARPLDGVPFPRKSLCALGAACEVADWHDLRSLPIEKALNRAVPAGFKCDPAMRRIVAFNDDPSTTHADIMALFDRAIDAAEAKATGAA